MADASENHSRRTEKANGRGRRLHVRRRSKVRNPQAWGKSDAMLPKAIRVPLDKLDENLSRIKQIVAYCT